jgi:hypothetical protein
MDDKARAQLLAEIEDAREQLAESLCNVTNLLRYTSLTNEEKDFIIAELMKSIQVLKYHIE